MNCTLPGSSVHGILQARILEWVAIPCPGDLLYPNFLFFFKKKRTALWKTAFCCPPAWDVVENKGGGDEVNVWQEFRVY